MKHLSPTEALQANLRKAARDSLAGSTSGLTLLDHLPTDVMPTPEMLEAVYAITGSGDEHRRLRAHGNFRMTAETESAFCRAALKRWAALNPEQEPEPEPAPEPPLVHHSVALHFFTRGPVAREDVEDKLYDALQSHTALNGVKAVWLDREQFADELAAAVKARDVDESNDGEIEALWDLAGSACGAFNVYDDDAPNEHAQTETELAQ